MSVATKNTTDLADILPLKARIQALNVCVVSGMTSEAVGGLASYMRFLLRHLAQDCRVSAVGRFQSQGPGRCEYAASEQPRTIDNGLYQTRIIAPKPSYKPILKQLHRITSRPALNGLAIAAIKGAYQNALREAIPEGVNVVHFVGTGWELIGFAALAEARRRGAAFTVLPAVHPGQWGDSWLDVALYNQADAVLTLSDYEKQHLIKHGTDTNRLHTIGLGPGTNGTGDGERFRVKHGLGERPLVLFIGRKDRGKGYHALRQAMERVVNAVPDVCLIAIGPDSEPPYPPIPDGALLDLGRADETEKEDALAACDVFCLPSTGESFGIVYAEAWSYDKPVIGGPAPAVRELITEGVNGYCVSQAPEEIAPVLIRLMKDPILAQHLGAAGQALQQERYTWDAVAEAHKSVYRQLLSD
jgi:glycosyltransferase involved in cell wall biosynthesis